MTADIFNEETACRFWEEQRQRVTDAESEETIDFSEMKFPEDPSGNYFHGITFQNDIDFTDATFMHSTVFSKAVFEQSVVFENCIFPDGGIFVFTEFHGDAEFMGIISDNKMRFAGVVFSQDADFSGSTFNAIAVFESEESPADSKHKKTEFGYFANFDKCIWKEHVHFLNVTFHDDACFKNGVFEYEANFDQCDFRGRGNFENVRFLEYSGKKDKRRNRFRLHNNTFAGLVSFEDTHFDCKVRFTNNEFKDQADFQRTRFNNIAFIDRKNSFKGRLFLDDNYKSFSRAEDAIELYRIAKQTAHHAGDSQMEGNYHFQEQCAANECERIITWEYIKSYHWKELRRFIAAYLELFIGKWIYGYGEKIHHIIISAIAVILICAALFFAFGGINYGSLPSEDLVVTGAKQYELRAAPNPPVVCHFNDDPPRDLSYAGNCLYFSVVTFTTLGYGDFQPYPQMRWLSAIEAAMGAALMAMFIVSLTRKFTR